MTMIERGLAKVSLSARQAERFFAPRRQSGLSSRTLFFASLAGVLCVHVAVLGWLLYRDSTMPDVVAQAVETPVEIVVEPPKPKSEPEPEAKQDPPPPPPKPSEAWEKPATSAPRAPSKEVVDTKATAAKTEAPKAAPPPRDGRPEPAKEVAAADKPPSAPAEAAAAKPDVDRPDAEPLDIAKPDVAKKPDAPASKTLPKTTEKNDPARQLSGLGTLPNYSFAAATPMADFPAGNEDNRYLAIVYGMVMSKNRYSGTEAARRGAQGTVSVSFVVDPIGHLRYQAVVQSSGQADLDAVAMAAVRAAAPFPPPPGAGPQSLIATMSFGPGVRR